MNKKIKLILNIIEVLLFLAAFIGFFLQYVVGWILGIGVVGEYKGYELALNFDGAPQNLGTLVPLLMVLGILIYAIIMLIKRIINLKKAPKLPKGGALRPLLSAIFFVLFPLIILFLSLSTVDVLGLASPKNYGGYYMGAGPYIVAYCSLVGGLMLFITESGIFKEKEVVELEKKEEVPNLKETKEAN